MTGLQIALTALAVVVALWLVVLIAETGNPTTGSTAPWRCSRSGSSPSW